MSKGKKKTGWPFQEGFISERHNETHVFTDFRWDDKTIERVWYVKPSDVTHSCVTIRPVFLAKS